MARNPSRISARRQLATLLDGHLKRGQNARGIPQSRWKPWINTDFAGTVGVSPNSVANWRSLDAPVPPEDIIPVLDTLFGDKQEFANHRRDMKEAWERARGLVPTEEPEVGNDWEPIDRVSYAALAEATLHQPTPANGPERYHLNATLRFSAAEHVDGDRTVIVGLRDAFLAIQASGYQVAQNSLIGERMTHPHIEPESGGLTITGPKYNGALRGNPIGEDQLATIEPGPKGNDTISITLCAGPRSLSFAYAPDPDCPPVAVEQKPNRTAILALVFGEAMKRDAQGRVVLAHASLRRKPAE